MSLRVRADGPELMDADDLDPDVYAAVVRDLARVNAVTLAIRPTLAFLRLVAAAAPGRPLRILDVGFGDGDALRAVERWARRRDVAVELVGVDLNPRSERAARLRTPAASDIRWVTGDYADMGDGWDAVISSLVAHHMAEAELVAFLRFMEASARCWLVNDLHRHLLSYHGYPLLARAAGWHPIVRHDGRLSIARGFRPAEWRALLDRADVADARVFRAFPFRLCVERRR